MTASSTRDASVIGTSVRRADVLGKVTGRGAATPATCAARHAARARSSAARSRTPTSGASTRRRRSPIPASRRCSRTRTCRACCTTARRIRARPPCTSDQYILDTKVRYWGEGVAAVAAVSEEIAEEALDLIEVEYEELPARLHRRGGARARRAARSTTSAPAATWCSTRCVVDARRRRARASPRPTSSSRASYEMGRPTPAYMEPNVCVCQWDGDGKLTMWISTQTAVHGARHPRRGARPAAAPRCACWSTTWAAASAPSRISSRPSSCARCSRRETRRPVRMEFTRKETFLGGRSRHPGTVWLKQGFRKDGTITARQARVVFNSGAYGSHGPGVTAVGTAALTSLYRCDNVHLEGRCVYTNTPIAGAYRGYGVVQTYYALDIQMDEAAEKLGMDPAELKLKNAVREGDLAPSGHPIVGHGLEDCIRRGMRGDSTGQIAARRARPNRGRHRRGWGMGCEMHGSSAYPGHQGAGQRHGAHERGRHGAAASPARPAWAPARTPRSRRSWPRSSACASRTSSVVHGDTDVVPWDIGAFASHTTYMGGRAAQMAAARGEAADARARGRGARSVAADDLEVRDGVISVKGSDRRLTVRDAVRPKRGIPSAQLVGIGDLQADQVVFVRRALRRGARSTPRPARSTCCRSSRCTRSAR